jgi:hypothetical protein
MMPLEEAAEQPLRAGISEAAQGRHMQATHEHWVAEFATEVMRLWPRLELDDAEHIGDALWQELAWRGLEPTDAAGRWAHRTGAGAEPLRQAPPRR